MSSVTGKVFALALLFGGAACAQHTHVYIGDLGPDHVLIAWGSTDGDNTIGRSSPPLGRVEVKIAGRSIIVPDRNWTEVRDLEPAKDYPYEVLVNGNRLGGGTITTWPAKADRLVFLSVGDWGSGDSEEYRIAAAMTEEFKKRQNSPDPIRFVITTGDNLYAQQSFMGPQHSGASDRDWEKRFFVPFGDVIASVPFYPSLGNHDGNESEQREDLAAYLDNFFFPGGKAARYYTFDFGGLADFFALDSTYNSDRGAPAPAYTPEGPQSKWLEQALPASTAQWKIAYFHNPPYTAGPRHPPSLPQLRHWISLFQQSGVRVVFSGHEHNFQLSDPRKTGNIQFVVSGSGGEVRRGDVKSYMNRAAIAGWAPQNQFLLVEIEGKSMRITPLGYETIHPVDARGQSVQMPIVVQLP